MDTRYVKAFLESVQHVFAMALQVPVALGSRDRERSGDELRGVVYLSGNVEGTVALRLSETTASRLVALFTGARLTSDSPDFADAVGELVNMVCGGARALLGYTGVSAGCPRVERGVGRQPGEACVVIPCTSGCGDVTIEVSLRERR